jgi:hypothetical protein
MDEDDARAVEARRTNSLFRPLAGSEGWGELCNILMKQIEVRRQKFELVPLKSLDGALEQEFVKGEIAMAHMVIQLPASLLEDARTVLDSVKEQDDG